MNSIPQQSAGIKPGKKEFSETWTIRGMLRADELLDECESNPRRTARAIEALLELWGHQLVARGLHAEAGAVRALIATTFGGVDRAELESCLADAEESALREALELSRGDLATALAIGGSPLAGVVSAMHRADERRARDRSEVSELVRLSRGVQ